MKTIYIKAWTTALLMLIAVVTAAQTTRIEFTAPDSYPEGIAYDSTADVFYVSSVRTGTIGKVDRQGNYSVLYSDNNLKSTFGMKIEPGQRRLWVCAGDPNYSRFIDSATYRKIARLIAIDLTTGQKTADIDLARLFTGRHFANDLTVDNEGNLYITDSFSPVIYKVSAGSTTPVLFAQNNWFGSAGVGLNGIAWHPGGFLLVANNGRGSVLKVDAKDPQRVTRVQVRQFFPGADGLLIDAEGNLVLVQNKGVNRIFQLKSTDNWQTASVSAATASADMFSFPSTAALSRGQVWVMNAKLHELSDSSSVPSQKFSIQHARFIPVK